MSDVSDLVDATLPQPALPVPTGTPADVPPPRLAPALPSLPTGGRPSLPTNAKAAPAPTAPTSAGAADQAAAPETASTEELDPVAAAAASGNPHAMAAAAHFAAMKQAATMPQVRSVRKQKRRSKKPIVVPVLLLGVLAGAAYVGRDSAFITRLQGEGYDTSALPMIVYPRPTPAGVERSITQYNVTVDAAGVPTAVDEFTDILGNSNTGDRSIERRASRFSFVDGVPTEPALSVVEQQVIVAGAFTYVSAEVDGEPWEQRDRAWRTLGPEAGDFWMYQDLVDQSLRHVPRVETVSETVDAVDVTTYRWEIPFGELYESAPSAYSPFGVLSGNADPASIVTLTISVDADGVVRVLDIRLDLESVIEHATAKADGLEYPYGFRVELDSLDDTAPTITAPTNVAQPAPSAEPAAEGGA
ncbi:MAG: hypothetical protein NTZ21_09160 [Actinobacteria bacterium]|nr:hypothetical protein [Actinomycetota bacterium]